LAIMRFCGVTSSCCSAFFFAVVLFFCLFFKTVLLFVNFCFPCSFLPCLLWQNLHVICIFKLIYMHTWYP
jgi:hypothetical protein